MKNLSIYILVALLLCCYSVYCQDNEAPKNPENPAPQVDQGGQQELQAIMQPLMGQPQNEAEHNKLLENIKAAAPKLEAFLKKYPKTEPGFQAHLVLFQVYHRFMGEAAKAKQLLQDCIKNFPERLQPHFFLFQMYLDEKKEKEAKAEGRDYL